MQIIILTGTIGSGKSTVAGILRGLGAAVIDSDEIARQVIAPGTAAFYEVVETFGNDILTARSDIDRKKLAAEVFNNPEALTKLNTLIHPRVDQQVEALLRQYESAGKKAAFIEMAIVTGARWKELVNQVWVVKVSQEIALRRLEKRGFSQSEALARLANQPGLENRVIKGLRIITNDGNLHELRKQVEKLWQKIDNENE